jgi:hypothetical protein
LHAGYTRNAHKTHINAHARIKKMQLGSCEGAVLNRQDGAVMRFMTHRENTARFFFRGCGPIFYGENKK